MTVTGVTGVTGVTAVTGVTGVTWVAGLVGMTGAAAADPRELVASALVGLAVLVRGDGRDGARETRRLLRGRGDDEVAPRRAPLTVEEVAEAMVLLAVALRSGCGVVEAVEAVAAVSGGRVRRDLRSVAAARRWGVEPLRSWSAIDPGWSSVARVLGVAARAGLPPSRLLVDASRDHRAAELAALDVAGARVGVRLVGPLGLAFLPAFCLTTVVPLVIALATEVLQG